MFWGLGARWNGQRKQEFNQDHWRGNTELCPGILCLRFKKSGAMTVSHLRFGAEPIKSTYLIQRANFIAVHQFKFLERYPVLDPAVDGATLLLNSPYDESGGMATPAARRSAGDNR